MIFRSIAVLSIIISFFSISWFCFGRPPSSTAEQGEFLQPCLNMCKKPEFTIQNCPRIIRQCKDSACVGDQYNPQWENNVFLRIPNFQYLVLKEFKDNYDSCINTQVSAKLNTFLCNHFVEDIKNNDQLSKGRKLLCPGGTNPQNNNCENYCASDTGSFFKIKSNSWPGDHCEGVALYSLIRNTHDFRSTPSYQNCFNHMRNEPTVQNIIRQLNSSQQASNSFRWVGCELGQPCEDEVKKAFRQASSKCSEAHINMAQCCHFPEQCMSGVLGNALKLAATFKNIVGGISDRCRMFKDHFFSNRGATASVITQCMWRVRSCKRTCNTEIQNVKNVLKKHCNYRDGDTVHDENRHSCSPNFFKMYITDQQENEDATCNIASLNPQGEQKDRKVTFMDIPDECSSSGAMLQRGMEDLASTMNEIMVVAQECRDIASGPGPHKPTPPPGIPTPSPPTRTPPPGPDNPIAGPGPTVSIGGGGSQEEKEKGGDGLPSTSNRRPIGPFAGPLPLEEEEEDSKEKGLAPLPGDLGAGGGGSGIGGGGSGSGGGGSLDDEEDGRAVASDEGPDSLITGFGGSKGFGGYGGGGSAGSERGPQGQKPGEVVEKSAEVDLKDLFKGPKVHPNPIFRKMGGPHENIFEIISRRYDYMCQTKRFDCE